MISYTQKQLKDPSISTSKEWLLTDGDGGYACSTISFMNTRRQHSLLTVSTNFPLRRFTLLNKLDEEVIVDGKSYLLSTNHYPDTLFPEGYKYLSKFVFDHFPQVSFDLAGCQVTKKILMPKGSSTVYCHYENNSKKSITLRLLPLISFRLKDSLRKAGDGFLVDELPDGVRIIADMNLPRLYLKLSQIYATTPESHWYYDFIYVHDADLYDADREDLFNIGFWETELEPGKGLTFAASTRDLAEFDYAEIEAKYIESIEKRRSLSGLPKRYIHLIDSASNHLARSRSIRSLAIIDGYPYGGLATVESLLSLNGISYAAEKRNYEQEFLYELVSNEVGGAFPATMEETTFQISYGNPKIPLYFAVALKRCADRDKNSNCLRRYLPIMEDAAEIIMQNNLGGRRLNGTCLIDAPGEKAAGIRTTVENALVNALWYNLLKVIDEAKTSADPLSGYDEIIAEIETNYFASFFTDDGKYKGMEDGSVLCPDMIVPLVVPYSPLAAQQRESIFKQLTPGFIASLQDPSIHNAPIQACNLTAIYLTEAGAGLDSCTEETAQLKAILTEMFTLHGFTNCVDGLPKCGIDLTEHHPQDLSSSVVTGEAIRIIKKLKFR